jgi:hypothetical protein
LRNAIQSQRCSLKKSREEEEGQRERERETDASSRWYLEGMLLLPTSPLDSTPLRRGTGRGCGYFEESDPKQEVFPEKEQRGRRQQRPTLTLTLPPPNL